MEKLNLTSKWWTTPGGYDKIERVLLSLQSRLGEIDNTRQDGKFISHNGSIPPGQAVLHFLLHKCYRLVHLIQSKSEASSGSLPVSEHLLPIYQNLTTLASCLSQLLKFGVRLTTEECVPYQMKLSAIDRQRKGGIFYGTDGKSIPEGQAEVVSQLEHCYQLLASLKE